jgi:hypothetical protein
MAERDSSDYGALTDAMGTVIPSGAPPMPTMLGNMSEADRERLRARQQRELVSHEGSAARMADAMGTVSKIGHYLFMISCCEIVFVTLLYLKVYRRGGTPRLMIHKTSRSFGLGTRCVRVCTRSQPLRRSGSCANIYPSKSDTTCASAPPTSLSLDKVGRTPTQEHPPPYQPPLPPIHPHSSSSRQVGRDVALSWWAVATPEFASAMSQAAIAVRLHMLKAADMRANDRGLPVEKQELVVPLVCEALSVLGEAPTPIATAAARDRDGYDGR